MDVKKFKELPVIGILRGITRDVVEPLIETIVSSGLKTIEITMNTPEAGELIEAASGAAKGRLTIGAGTVLTMDDVLLALESGASFVVLPTLIRDVVEYCKKSGIPVFPGALTPQEIYNAHSSGATMVKVFPAKVFGPAYFKEIKGPFKNIELLACGGVNPKNINSFFENGASAVAFGASIFKKEWFEKRDFESIGNSIKDLMRARRT